MGAVNCGDSAGERCYHGHFIAYSRGCVQETVQETTGQTPVTVLLATHNGERWLAELLESLLAQDYAELHIVVRDDASHDATPTVLATFRERARERITLLDNTRQTPEGSNANFKALIDHALTWRRESHFLFCDQDDIWQPDKVSVLLARMPADTSRPALAYSDMRVVDERGALIAGSFMEHQHLSPESGLSRLLVQNHVSGCASLVNRAALELAWPLPAATLVHDWWLALACAAGGHLEYCDRPLLDYRQHDDNAIGARGFNRRYLWHRARGDRGTRLAQLYAQAQALKTRLQQRGLASPDALESFVATRELGRWRRLRALCAAGHTRSGLVRNLPLWLETE